jgi:hypothetical protein
MDIKTRGLEKLEKRGWEGDLIEVGSQIAIRL